MYVCMHFPYQGSLFGAFLFLEICLELLQFYNFFNILAPVPIVSI